MLTSQLCYTLCLCHNYQASLCFAVLGNNVFSTCRFLFEEGLGTRLHNDGNAMQGEGGGDSKILNFSVSKPPASLYRKHNNTGSCPTLAPRLHTECAKCHNEHCMRPGKMTSDAPWSFFDSQPPHIQHVILITNFIANILHSSVWKGCWTSEGFILPNSWSGW